MSADTSAVQNGNALNFINKAPISSVKWVHRETLTPLEENPNRVAPMELELLKTSILEDGFTQPLVITPDNELIDGFHRWKVSGSAELMERYCGYVPVVVNQPENRSHHLMSTIRHNRARGTHGVIDMSKILQGMIDEGLSQEEIMARLGMEEEEVVRLALQQGIPASKLVRDHEFSRAWEV